MATQYAGTNRSRDPTRILPVDPARIGRFNFTGSPDSVLDSWEINLRDDTVDAANLKEAAERLRTRDVPVAFPTETVYGLGADATRSLAVQGIYKAKQRPSDNPLIVHFSSLEQLRGLLRSGKAHVAHDNTNIATEDSDPIPSIYKPLIRKFWPGPLTILLPNPENSPLAPEVTAGLDTFGARMPKSILALALIKLAGAPLAAPSANASTKPSPTTAEHVKYDLDGRIDVILDGGPSDVGVESTVVDGLSKPPLILRPGGISIEQLRECPGWEEVEIGYKDSSEKEKAPRAPGMKYRHYSPKATVVLFESGSRPPTLADIEQRLGSKRSVGVVRTKSWELGLGQPVTSVDDKTHESTSEDASISSNGTRTAEKILRSSIPEFTISNNKLNSQNVSAHADSLPSTLSNLLQSLTSHATPPARHYTFQTSLPSPTSSPIHMHDIALGAKMDDIARGLFSALRELDKRAVDVIFVEGVSDEHDGSVAAAVMNRLRKAAGVRVYETS